MLALHKTATFLFDIQNEEIIVRHSQSARYGASSEALADWEFFYTFKIILRCVSPQCQALGI